MADYGRVIDSTQNTNAVYIDRFGKSGKTSTKISNPPGGADHFSLGWGQAPEEPQKFGRKRFDQPPKMGENMAGKGEGGFKGSFGDNPKNNSGGAKESKSNSTKPHTSVRVRQNPGGKSNIIFGDDDSNYDHYRK